VNNKHSFEILYKRFQPSLFQYASYLTGNPNEASEIVNDVFIAVWHKKSSLSYDISLKSYLYRAVKNKCINFLKKQKLDTVNDDDTINAISSYQTDQSIIDKEQRLILEKVMNTLPPKCKQIFSMSRIDELKNAEIADLLDISIKTVEAQITKALKIFKKKLTIE
jgi:RNA polymerase sigma-70 factor, ECF subfamily